MTKVVDRLEPFQVMTVAPVNPPPFAVRVKPGPPAIALVGEILVSVRGFVMVKGSAVGEVRPDCATLTSAEPALAMSAAGTVAVSCPALTKVVDRLEPFQVMTVEAVKPPPLAVIVNPGPPAVAVFGEMLLRLSGGLMVNGSAGGVVCPDCWTETIAVPAAAMNDAGIVAVTCPELMKVVVRTELFQMIWVAPVKPEPFAVRVKAPPPASALLGVMLLRVKGTSKMVNVSEGLPS